jgi:hypothetical protein
MPWDHRDALYHTVQLEIVTVGEAKTPHALVLLLHPSDRLHDIEGELPPGVFLTRAVRNLRVKLSLDRDLRELRDKSLECINIERKLFGIQASEMDTQQMHPMLFRQVQDRRKEQLAQQVQQLTACTTEDLVRELESRGYRGAGLSRVELESRMRTVLLEEVERVDICGEMSGAGRAMVTRIFQQFDKDRDGGLSFHEMNTMLNCLGLPVMYDHEDYRAMLEETGFSTTRAGLLDERGLLAYYQKYGQLARDASTLGFGSLSGFVSGRLEINCS